MPFTHRFLVLIAVITLSFSTACTSSNPTGDSDVDESRDGDSDAGDVDPDGDVPACDGIGSGDDDSDNDTIPDDREGEGDVDDDGIPNYCDTDSDGDGIPDIEEGEEDCDGDGMPNFLDADSDDDFLDDSEERALGTDPCDVDTDDDDITDWIEVEIGRDPANAAGLEPNDVFVILPYEEIPYELEIRFSTLLSQADLYFLFDSTGSMRTEISLIEESFSTLIIPEVADIVHDIEVGLGHYQDIPVGGFGDNGDLPFIHAQNITAELAAVEDAFDSLQLGNGDDLPESGVLALHSVATGEGIGKWVDPAPACSDDHAGYPCFRPFSLPIVLLITDATFHNGPPDGTAFPYDLAGLPTWPEAIEGLNEIGAIVMGFSSVPDSDSDPVVSHLNATAEATGAVRADGTPLVFDTVSSGEQLDQLIIDAISDLSSDVLRDVTAFAIDDAERDDELDASRFITSIEPLFAEPGSGVREFDDTTFFDVEPGTEVTFNVTFENTILEEEDYPQLFLGHLLVVDENHRARMDHRRLILLVPPDCGCIP